LGSLPSSVGIAPCIRLFSGEMRTADASAGTGSSCAYATLAFDSASVQVPPRSLSTAWAGASPPPTLKLPAASVDSKPASA